MSPIFAGPNGLFQTSQVLTTENLRLEEIKLYNKIPSLTISFHLQRLLSTSSLISFGKRNHGKSLHRSWFLAIAVPLTQQQVYIPHGQYHWGLHSLSTCRIHRSFHIMLYLNLCTNLLGHVYEWPLRAMPALIYFTFKCKALVHESTHATQMSIFLPWAASTGLCRRAVPQWENLGSNLNTPKSGITAISFSEPQYLQPY